MYSSVSTVANDIVAVLGGYYAGLASGMFSPTGDTRFLHAVTTVLESALDGGVSTSARNLFHIKYGDLFQAVQVVYNNFNDVENSCDEWLYMQAEEEFVIRETLNMLHYLVSIEGEC